MKPTDEQRKVFLEWCGFSLRCPPENDAYKRGIWNYPDGMYGDVELTLDNLFKYAVPKLMDKWNNVDLETRTFVAPDEEMVVSTSCEIWSNCGQGCKKASNRDPALALFWAIWEVIEGEVIDE